MLVGEISAEEVRGQLHRILVSRGFARNERLSRFLAFVVERHLDGRAAEIKESVLAAEIFGRKPGYDPKLDSIVRTEAIRLRSRLEQYYATEGLADPVRIELPKGGYVPVYRAVENSSVPPPASTGRSRLVWGGMVLAVLLAGITLAWSRWGSPQPAVIAVLPLRNAGGDPSQEYFADGLTDELIHNLSVIDGLTVRSRTSSFALKGSAKTVRQAGQMMSAEYVLEGAVERSNGRLRMTARLIRVRDDVPVWSGKFDREVSDIFAVQDEISRGIANELRVKLNAGRRRYETSVAAYDAYLRGRGRETIPGLFLPERIAALEEAIAKDATFAPAYAALGALYAVRSVQFPLDHDASELEKMHAMTARALELDPLLAQGYDALGLVQARHAKWAEAEKSFRRAIELEPNNSTPYVHMVLWLMRVLDRQNEGRELLDHAAQLDPLSADIQATYGELLLQAGRFEDAWPHCARLPETDPFRRRCQARVEVGRGRVQVAIAIMQAEPNLANFPMARGTLGYAYGVAGRRDIAEKMAAATKFPNERALIFAGLRDADRTLEALNGMSELSAQRTATFLHLPEMSFLRDDPRFAALRKKAGLP